MTVELPLGTDAAEVHDRLARWVDTHHDEAAAFLRAMVQVPTDTPPGDNAHHAERTAVLLEGFGYEVERHRVPDAYVREAGLKSITNLIVRKRFGPGPTFVLNAHGDVVPPGQGWSQPPYDGNIGDGRLYGRGAAVSKADFATFTFALRALDAVVTECGIAPKGAVELHFTYDEEFGGLAGPKFLLENKLTKPDFVICAGFSYAVVTAHNGCLQLEVTVKGQPAHAAIPETGIDALAAAIGIIQALYAERIGYENLRSAVPGITSPTIAVGLIQGGTNTNVVMEKVTFKLDRRMIPEEDPAAVEARLSHVIGSTAVAYPGVDVEIRRLLLASALRPLPGHERLANALEKHATRVFGEPIPLQGTPIYTDARHYGEAGIPVVIYGAGPHTLLEANAKRADENLLLEDLRRATHVVAASLYDLLS